MIYLDYNATTPLCEPARAAMAPFLGKHFGNPSSVHAAGRETRAAIDEARDRFAALLRVKPGEIIFTASGTESNNLAVIGLAQAHRDKGRHLICSAIEHHAVLHACQHLQESGEFEVTCVEARPEGMIDLEQLRAAIRPDTTLISVMLANNETGVVQPWKEIREICAERGILYHTDAVQAFGKVEMDLRGIVAASFAAHKFYGPLGAGFLYLRGGVPLRAIQFGGAHENQRRPGTENTAAIAGMAAAAQFAESARERETARLGALRDRLWHEIAELWPDVVRNGSPERSLANTLNISFPQVDSETMLMALDLEGICASSGSACMVGSVVPSHVLTAMGCDAKRAGSAIRFSLGHFTTESDIESAILALQRISARLQFGRGNDSMAANVLR